jgi:EAL domain-containing protein (putative c-di-GMP-specific phosphodiesterase class I)
MKLVTSGAEARLVEYLTTNKDTLISDGIAITFNFNKLLEHYRSDYQIKIATNLLTDLLKHQEGGLYLFRDMSLTVVAIGLSSTLLEKAIFQLRYLFMDDPLAYTLDGQENLEFCSVYHLKKDYNDVAAAARVKMIGGKAKATTTGSSSGATQNNSISGVAESQSTVKAQPQRTQYFDSSNLAQLERMILESDISPSIRRQPVCATIPNMSVRRVFDELYLNINHLRQLIKTDVDIISNRWLFKYLTLEMDNRMLALLRQKADQFLGSPISLNLNVRTLISDNFAKFDASLKPAAKVSVVIEIQASDVFEDMYAFISARDYVQKLGYRICLDGLNNHSFCMIDRDLLGVDLLKLQWNATVRDEAFNRDNNILTNAVKRSGSNRIILTRCDNRQAVDYGQSLGISLFQGRYLDELIDPMSETVN